MRQSSLLTYSFYQLLQVNLLVDFLVKYFILCVIFYNLVICIFWVFEKFYIEYCTITIFSYIYFIALLQSPKFNITQINLNLFSGIIFLFFAFVD